MTSNNAGMTGRGDFGLRDIPLIENNGHTNKACMHQSPLRGTVSVAPFIFVFKDIYGMI